MSLGLWINGVRLQCDCAFALMPACGECELKGQTVEEWNKTLYAKPEREVKTEVTTVDNAQEEPNSKQALPPNDGAQVVRFYIIDAASYVEMSPAETRRHRTEVFRRKTPHK